MPIDQPQEAEPPRRHVEMRSSGPWPETENQHNVGLTRVRLGDIAHDVYIEPILRWRAETSRKEALAKPAN